MLETNQYEESEKNLRSIAKFNGRELENSEFNQKFEELKRRYSDAQKGTEKTLLGKQTTPYNNANSPGLT